MLLLAARHGETDLPGKCRGRRTHCVLTPEGTAQTIENLGTMHAGGARILYTSTMARASVAGVLAKENFGMEHRALPDLDAIDGGDWEGIPWKEVAERWPEQLALCDTDARAMVIPNALESVADFEERIFRALRAIHEECRNGFRGSLPIAGVVTHGCVIGVIDAAARHSPKISLRDKGLPPGAMRAYLLDDTGLRPASGSIAPVS